MSRTDHPVRALPGKPRDTRVSSEFPELLSSLEKLGYGRSTSPGSRTVEAAHLSPSAEFAGSQPQPQQFGRRYWNSAPNVNISEPTFFCV